MRTDFYFDSVGGGSIHGCLWQPETPPIGVLQIVHGIAEYVERYDAFAEHLCSLGFVVVAEDHMGHGKSVNGTLGYFSGGWFNAVADSYRLLTDTREKYPDLPYVLFGHSMGSFMARTILAKYPDSGISAAVICGTGWQPKPMLITGKTACSLVCAKDGDRTANKNLENLVFGTYNKRVEHPRTAYDWLSRDAASVDRYIADPLCGFTPTAGLLRDLMTGILYIESKKALCAMCKELPVLFVAGGDDPVGNYGKGVQQSANAFRDAGMTDVTVRIFPLGRHEILNEINKEEVFRYISDWICEKLNAR